MAVNDLIIFRKGTSEQWNSANPILASGEPGYDLTNEILKIGDGVSSWSGLPPIGVGLNNLVEDLSPQLGGDLDLNSYDIINSGNININGNITCDYVYSDLSGTIVYANSGNFIDSLKLNGTNVSISGHTHASSNITDFNSSVSGLLPVKDIVPGSDISVSNISGIYTITNSMTSVETSASIVTTVFNKTGSSIPKMTAVYVNGGQGDLPTIQKAIATADISSAGTYGITYEIIDNMSTGRVIVLGALTGLNTDQFNPTSPHGDVNGTVLYLSPTISGALTATKPYAPYHIVAMGTIVRTHQNEGVIEVRVQNGYELEELHNVAITGVTNGQFLQYNSSGSLWVPSSSGNFTTLQVNGTGVSISGHTHTSSNITDFNSSVSGLLPVKNITPSSYVDIVSSTGNFTISVTGLQPSGSYAASSHTHTASNITDFNSSVSGLVNGVYAPLTGTLNQFSSTTSSQLISIISDETGSGLLVFNDSPAFTGIPLVPTANSGTNTNQIASTSFVRTEISNLVNSAPSTLDTLNELATALGNDANFSTTITNSLASKANLSGSIFTGAISGPSGDFTTLKQNGSIVSVTGHTHVSSDITNFNSSVSGLLPVKNLIAGTGMALSSLDGVFTINATSTGGGGGGIFNIVEDTTPQLGGDLDLNSYDIINNGNININGNITCDYVYSDLSGTIVNANSGNFINSLQVNNLNVSVSGHAHTSSNITDFNSSVSGLLPVTNIVAGTGMMVSSSAGSYTINLDAYSVLIGDGSATSYTVTHNLGATNDVHVSVRETSTNYYVYPDIKYVNSNSVIIEFSSAPTSNQYRVSIIGF